MKSFNNKIFGILLLAGVILLNAALPAFAVKDFNIKNNSDSYLYVNGTSGNVGIGSLVPGQKLDILGSLRITGQYFGDGSQLTGIPGTIAGLGAGYITKAATATTINDSALFQLGSNIGLGSAVPGQMLDVQGTVRSIGFITSGGYTQSGTSANTITGVMTFSNATNSALFTGGNVGVGSTAPGQLLDVQGTVRAIGFTLPTGAASGSVLMTNSVGVGTWIPVSGIATATSPGGNQNAVQRNNGGSLSGDETLFSFNGTNVGIGTTNGTLALLDVRGTARIATNLGIGTTTTNNALGVLGAVSIGDATYAGTSAPTNGLLVKGNVGIGTISSQTALTVNNGNVGIGTWTAGGGNLIVNGGGNVGINTAWPGTTLDVNGSFRVVGVTGDSTFTNNVGIGSITPTQALDVSGSAAVSANLGVGTTTPQAKLAVLGNVGIGTWTAAGGSLIIRGAGNVGIGSAWPGQVLDVQGTARMTGFTLNLSPSTGYVLQTNSVGVGTWVAPGTILNTSTAAGGLNALQYNSPIGTLAGSESVFSFNGTNVGIGTTNGVQILDIRSTVSMASNVGIGTTATGIAARLAVIGGNVGIGTIAPQAALAVTSGNVGIGTWTAAGNRLEVVGTALINGALRVGNNSGAGQYSLSLGSTSGGGTISANADGGIAFGTATLFGGTTASIVNDTVSGLAGGYVFGSFGAATIRAASYGAVAIGNVYSGTVDTSILSNGLGSFAMGNAEDGDLKSSGTGSVAMGLAVSGTLQALGQASFALGENVQAVPSNSFALGKSVVNTVADSFMVGFTATPTLMVDASNVGIGTTLTGATGKLNVIGNVGIGTVTPQGALMVTTGNVGIGTWTAEGGSLIIRGAGNVGIGSAWPGQVLDVQGTARMTGFTLNLSPSTGYVLQTNSVGVGTWVAPSTILSAGTPSGGQNAVQRNNSGSFSGDETLFSFNGTNVGIGTTNGTLALLDVRGTARIATNLGIGTTTTNNALGVLGAVSIGDATYAGTSAPTNGLLVKGNVGIGTISSQTALAVNNGNVGIGTWTAGGGNLIVNGGGNVGIGTAWPGAVLDVNGSFRVSNGASTPSYFTTNVGINSTAPGQLLDVQGVVRTTGFTLNLSPNTGYVLQTNSVGVGTWVAPSTILSAGTPSGGQNAVQRNNSGSFSGDETLFSFNGTNVGIGTTNGVQILDVRSTVSMASNVGIGTTATGIAARLAVIGGNVGIGTITPQGAFVVTNGNVGIGTWVAPNPLTLGPSLSGDVIKFTNASGGSTSPSAINLGSTYTSVPGSAPKIKFWDASNSPGFGIAAGYQLDYMAPTHAFWDNNGGSQVMTLSGGNLGIGTNSPQGALTVTGGNVGIGTWTAAGGNLIIKGGGNVGIGSAWPGQMLDVQGTVRTTGFTLNLSPSTGYVLQTNSVGVGTWVAPSTILSAGTPSGGQNAVQRNNSGSFSGDETLFSFNGTNVGIGTTNGVQILDVRSTVSMASNVGIGTTATGIAARLAVIGGNVGIGTITPQGALVVTSGNVGIGTWTARSLFSVAGGVGIGTIYAAHYPAPANGLLVSGSVGIGTWSAVTNFAGALQNILSVRGEADTSGNGGQGISLVAGSQASNFVGAQFYLNGSTGSGGNALLYGAYSPQSNTGGGYVEILGGDTTNPKAANVFIAGGNSGNGGITLAGDVILGVTGGSVHRGNVGVGTTLPQTRFAVVGGNVGIGTWTAGGGSLIVNGGSNVGIGSAWPGQMLDVQGTVRTTGFTLNLSPSTGYVLQTNSVGVGTWVAPSTILSAGTPSGGQNAVQRNNSGSFSGDETLFSFNGTNVGIGTTDGTLALLDVRGTARIATNLGIGTTTTNNALGVLGAVSIGDATYAGTSAPTNGLLVKGNVGIGSLAPGVALDVNGDIRASNTGDSYFLGNLGVGSTAPGRALDVSGAVYVNGNVGIGTSSSQSAFVVTNGNVGIGTWTAAGGSLIIRGAGNVGIGSAWPGQMLDVQGTVRTTGFTLNLSPSTGYVLQTNSVGVGTWVAASTLLNTASAAGGINAVQYNNPVGTLAGSESVFSFNGTNVGVGTTNGVQVLDVRSTVSMASNVGVGTTATGIAARLAVIGGNVGIGTITPQGAFTVSSGNVGIGTWAPNTTLNVFGTFGFSPSATTNITAGGGVTVTNTVMKVQGSGVAVTVTANPQIAAGVDGQMVILIGMSSANTLTLSNGTGLKLAGGVSITLGAGDTITFVYNATTSLWTEVARSINN